MPLETRPIQVKTTDHVYLDEGDLCYHFGVYSPRRGFEYSPTNQLILNFKKEPSRKANPNEWQYKIDAIKQVAGILRATFVRARNFHELTFVPIPPSKAVSDPEYDNRIIATLREAFPEESFHADIRELVTVKESLESHHSSAKRDPQRLIDNYCFNEDLAEPAPKNIVIFDDVLTSGSHFKAMKTVLSRRFPAARIYGLFISRVENQYF